jgi:hypothetical protein
LAKIFDELLLKGIKSGQVPARTSTARVWYREQAKAVGKVNETTLMKDKTNQFENRFRIGNMYMFFYDPKHKDTLPYYDRFPLIFPINRAKGGFLGINFHYLPLPLRARLMDNLYEIANNEKYDESTKLSISYKVLIATTKFKEFKPTIKHYLTSHVRSRMLYVNPVEWDIALFLDTARFEKATKTKVWEDSRKIIRNSK